MIDGPFGADDGGRLAFAVGVVTESEDDDYLGTVRVRYTWRGSEQETDQIRVVVPVAASGSGTYLLPEPGDEVLLAFQDGDINHPYVLGSLWNVDNEPPVDSDDRLGVMQIRSRGGHVISIHDTSGDERIEIVTAAGHRIVLSDESGSEHVTVEDNAGQSVVLDAASDSIEISGNRKITLSADEIEIEGRTGVSVTSTGEVSVSGLKINLN